MYKKLMIILTLGGSMACCAKDVSRVGIVNMSSETFTNLTVTGVANLDNITVAQKLVMTGPVNASGCQFGSVVVSGAINFNHVTLEQELSASGAFNAESSKFVDITLSGGIAMRDCTVAGSAKMSGGVSCENTTFQQDIDLAGQEFSFVDCKIMKNINIAKKSWFSSLFKAQKIKLKHGVVHGDIIFQEDGGIVEMSASTEFHGKVIRGTIVCKK